MLDGGAAWRFSLKAAKRVHHEDSKRTGVATVDGLDIDHHPLSIVVTVAIGVAVVAVYRSDTSSVCVTIVVG